MVAEGNDNNIDRSLEQALVSTSLENGFLIQRTSNLAGTARFLDDLTKHLRKRLKNEKVCLLARFVNLTNFRSKATRLLGFKMKA